MSKSSGTKNYTYKSLLKELENLNNKIIQINKRMGGVKNKIMEMANKVEADKIRKKIELK